MIKGIFCQLISYSLVIILFLEMQKYFIMFYDIAYAMITMFTLHYIYLFSMYDGKGNLIFLPKKIGIDSNLIT